MSDDASKDEVGYRRPPKQHQFQKGKSGNPRGRRRENQSMLLHLNDALNEMVTVTIGGKQKRMTKIEAGAKQFANKVASGDPQALKMLMGLQQTKEWNEVRAIADSAAPVDVAALLLAKARKIKAAHERDESAPPSTDVNPSDAVPQ
jgi:hypothetical protein